MTKDQYIRKLSRRERFVGFHAYQAATALQFSLRGNNIAARNHAAEARYWLNCYVISLIDTATGRSSE